MFDRQFAVTSWFDGVELSGSGNEVRCMTKETAAPRNLSAMAGDSSELGFDALKY